MQKQLIIFFLFLLFLNIIITSKCVENDKISLPKTIFGIKLTETERKIISNLILSSNKNPVVFANSLINLSLQKNGIESDLLPNFQNHHQHHNFSKRGGSSCTKISFEGESDTTNCGYGTKSVSGKCKSYADLTEEKQFKTCSIGECYDSSTALSCLSKKCRWIMKWEGEKCETNEECIGSCVNNICVNGKLGSSCSTSKGCDNNLYCSSGVCKYYPSEGEECTDYCNSPHLRCVSKICVKSKSNGQSCKSSEECASGYCTGNTCIPLKKVGEDCSGLFGLFSNCENDLSQLSIKLLKGSLYHYKIFPTYLSVCSNSKCKQLYSVGLGGECSTKDNCQPGLLCIDSKCQSKTSCSKDSDCGGYTCKCKPGSTQGSCMGEKEACSKHLTMLQICESYHCRSNGVIQDPDSCYRKMCGGYWKNYLGCIDSQYRSSFGRSIGRIYGYNPASIKGLNYQLIILGFFLSIFLYFN